MILNIFGILKTQPLATPVHKIHEAQLMNSLFLSYFINMHWLLCSGRILIETVMLIVINIILRRI